MALKHFAYPPLIITWDEKKTKFGLDCQPKSSLSHPKFENVQHVLNKFVKQRRLAMSFPSTVWTTKL